MSEPGQAAHKGTLTAVEDWFISRGVPHLIADYSATRDVFTRALPVLTLIVVVEVFFAGNLEWSWWANLLAVPAGLAAVLGFWALANRARDRRALAPPDDVGVPELAVFVFAPALLPLIFGGDVSDAAVTAGANIGLLALIYLTTSYALIPITRWAGIYLLRQLGEVFSLLARALPLVLLFGIVLIVNAEVWQMSAALNPGFLAAVVGLFVVIGTALLTVRIPRQVAALAAWDGPDDLRARLAGTPAERLGNTENCDEPPALTWRQWGNLGLVLLFAQGLQVLLVAVMLGAFFVTFGLLAITPETAESWAGAPLEELLSATFGDRQVVLSAELVRVSCFLGAFSGLYFAVTTITDENFRREFFDDVESDLRRVLAVRTVYLAGRASPAADRV